MNVVEPIFAQCRNKPSELALCAPGTEFNLVSYARLERSLNSICRRIIASDIAPRARIGVMVEDPIVHAMVLIALTRLGIVSASATRSDVSWPITLDGVIADRQHDSLLRDALVADATWTAGDDRPVDAKHLYRASYDDVCTIFLTSGNDGRQKKAIAMTHGMIATRLDRQKLFLGPRAPFCDRTHLDMPLSTVLGYQVMLGTLWRGGALVMTWDARKTLAALAAYNIQNIVASRQSLPNLAEVVEDHPSYRSQLLTVFSAGTLGPEQSERIRARLCPNLTIGYIAGDRTMVASMPAQLASGIPGAVGYVLPGVTVEIVDNQDRVLAPGQDGNLRIRSDYGVKEYLDNPSATRHAFRNGWFYPGDRGHLTAENAVVISGSVRSRTATQFERIEGVLLKHKY